MDLVLVLGVPPYLHRTGWKRFFLLQTLPQGPGAHSVEWALDLDLCLLDTGATQIQLVFGPWADRIEELQRLGIHIVHRTLLFLLALGPSQGPGGQ